MDRARRAKKIPDYNFRSPLNILSRHASKKTTLDDHHKETSHYAEDQTGFAYDAAILLRTLYYKFRPEKIFDFSKDSVSRAEAERLEAFFKKITDTRKQIFLQRKSGEDRDIFDYATKLFNRGRRGPQIPKTNIDYCLAVLESISYQEPEERCHSSTNLSNSPELYDRYLSSDSGQPLMLGHLTKILGIFDDSDKEIMLGILLKEKDGALQHHMGLYRESDDNTARVDYATYYAAKKALATEDPEEAMKHAFVFGILRGYNLRSTIGACFAQEMSLRWLFACKGWEQFRKMPGFYLDIEATRVLAHDSISKAAASDEDEAAAAVEGMIYINPHKAISELIDRQIAEYRAASNPKIADVTSNMFFDKPLCHEITVDPTTNAITISSTAILVTKALRLSMLERTART